jgi:tetratricopeptide (TPR) repeat protein
VDRNRLESWKEIADYLRTSVRTVQRWEKDEALPVRRHPHSKQDTVYAFQHEIDAWRVARSRGSPRTPISWESDIDAVRHQLAAERLPSVDRSLPQAERIIGRSKELQELHDFLANCRNGDLRVVGITGEPGIGKTALLNDFLFEARRRAPCRIARSQCSERLVDAQAYSPIIELLETLTAHDFNRPISQLLKLVAPTWYVQVAPLWASSDPSFLCVLDQARAASGERMKRELASFLAELSCDAPLALIIDDVHWADASTIELLAYLAKREGLDGVVFLLAYRPTEMSLVGHPFVPIRQELIKRRICKELPLSLLTETDVQAYLDRRFVRNTFPPELALSLHAKTEGSPFFLVELIHELREHDGLAETDGAWHVQHSHQELSNLYPASIQNMIQRKIDQLPTASRDLLLAAAVQGTDFDSFVVSRATGMDTAAAEDLLRDLDQVHAFVKRIVPSSPGRSVSEAETYAFVHILYQNAFYGSLTSARRAALSLRVAEALLERRPNHGEPIASQLALLYETGGEYRKAADWFLVAAGKAAQVHANQQSVALYEKAIQIAKELPGEVRRQLTLEAVLRLGELHLTISELEAAADDFQRAAEIAEETGLGEVQIDALCAAALAEFVFKRTERTRTLGERALHLAKAANFNYGIASAEAAIAMQRMCDGDVEGAVDLVARALPALMTSERTPTPLHAIEAVVHCSAYHAWQGRLEQAGPGIEWAMKRARERGVSYHIIECLFITGLGLGQSGQISPALASLEEAERIADLNGDRYWRPRIPNTRGWIYRELQDFERAIRVNQEGTGMGHEMRFPEGIASSHIHLAGIQITLGDLDRAREHLGKARLLLEDDPWFWWVYENRYRYELGRYWMAKGDLVQAKNAVGKLLDLASRTLKNKHIALGHMLRAEIRVLEDNREAAQIDYDKALDLVDDYPCPTIDWQIAKASAANCQKLHQSGRASELLARGRAVTRRLAESVVDARLRKTFLSSEAVRNLS